jgi:hypothetical protein
MVFVYVCVCVLVCLFVCLFVCLLVVVVISLVLVFSLFLSYFADFFAHFDKKQRQIDREKFAKMIEYLNLKYEPQEIDLLFNVSDNKQKNK